VGSFLDLEATAKRAVASVGRETVASADAMGD
jgi:hypothetical protein